VNIKYWKLSQNIFGLYIKAARIPLAAEYSVALHKNILRCGYNNTLNLSPVQGSMAVFRPSEIMTIFRSCVEPKNLTFCKDLPRG
jgi:hypothetical protein